jgi:hypothetical protein
MLDLSAITNCLSHLLEKLDFPRIPILFSHFIGDLFCQLIPLLDDKTGNGTQLQQ